MSANLVLEKVVLAGLCVAICASDWFLAPRMQAASSVDDELVTVQNAIAAIEGDKPDVVPAAKHAWQVWSRISERNAKVAEKDQPQWLSWCKADEVGQGSPRSECAIDGAVQKGSNRARPRKLSAPFVGRGVSATADGPALAPASAPIADDGRGKGLFEEIYFSPKLVESLRERYSASSSDQSSKKLDPSSMAVKALFKWVAHPNHKADYYSARELAVWDGASKQAEHKDPGFQSNFLDWNKWPRVAIRIDDDSPMCKPPGALKKPKLPKGLPVKNLSDFVYVQYCPQIDKYVWNDDVKEGDYLVLVGLHIITNFASSEEWTWSTYHWHPKADENTDGLTVRQAKLQHMTLDLPKTLAATLVGWRRKYRLDLQYSRKEKMEPDPGLAKLASFADNSCFVGQQANTVPSSVFNPYLEGMLKCGVYTNCVSCHSYAQYQQSGGIHVMTPESPMSRVFIEPGPRSTHFLWSLAEKLSK